MSATDEFARLQREFPPWETDRCGPLLGQLAEGLSTELSIMAKSGILVMGEVGHSAPNSYTRSFGDGSYLVVAHSGLLDFMFAVAQTLFGGVRYFEAGKTTIEPAQKPENVAHQLAALYTAWKTGQIWKEGGRLKPLSNQLPQRDAEMAKLLADMMIIFILAHELGHVQRSRPTKRLSNEIGGTTLTHEEELDADSAAVRFLFEQRERLGSIRMSLAGAMVALRVLSGLEKMGHRFPDDHPPPAERLAKLWSLTHELSGGEAKFWYVTTIAFAFDEHMEAAENLALGRGPKTALTADRIFSRLCAVLEEDVKGRPREQTLEVIKFDLDEAPLPVLRAVADTASRILRPLPEPFIATGGVATRHRVATLFLELLPQFPEKARRVFEDSRNRAEPNGDDDGDHRLPQ